MTQSVIRVPFPLQRFRAPDNLLSHVANVVPLVQPALPLNTAVRQDTRSLIERWWSLQFEMLAHFTIAPRDRQEPDTRASTCKRDPESPEAA